MIVRVYGVTDLHLDLNRLIRTHAGDLVYHLNGPLVNGEHKNDLLLIAGDTAEINAFRRKDDGVGGTFKRRPLMDLEAICAAYKKVIMIAGNHEFYHEELAEGINALRDATKHIDNLVVADNDVIDIDGRVQVIATTLWTDLRAADPIVMGAVKEGLNDYWHIRKLNENFTFVRIEPYDTVELYRKNREWLVQQVEAIKGEVPVVVMTHHAPIMAHCNSQHGGNLIDYAYAATDLENLILDNDKKVAVYFHGHTHDVRRTPVGDTVIVTAARGYQEKAYTHQILLEV